jgi:hypothetical protein
VGPAPNRGDPVVCGLRPESRPVHDGDSQSDFRDEVAGFSRLRLGTDTCEAPPRLPARATSSPSEARSSDGAYRNTTLIRCSGMRNVAWCHSRRKSEVQGRYEDVKYGFDTLQRDAIRRTVPFQVKVPNFKGNKRMRNTGLIRCSGMRYVAIGLITLHLGWQSCATYY